MTRTIKLFSLSAMAALVLGMLGASSALANGDFSFRSDGAAVSTTHFHGDEDVKNIFSVHFGNITCDATFTGEIKGTNTTKTVTLTPTYKNCLFAGSAATVTMNECDYVFTTDKKTVAGTPGGKYDVTTQIVCPAGKEITVTAPTVGTTKCTVHVPPQQLGTGITLTNVTGANGVEDITADIEQTDIKYSQTEGSGLGKCATADNTTGGKYTGSVTITGFNASGVSTSIWLE